MNGAPRNAACLTSRPASRGRAALQGLVLAFSVLVPGVGLAQAVDGNADPFEPPRLIDLPPFDQLTLDKANDQRVLRVYPLSPAERRAPASPRASDKLRIRLLDSGREYEVSWTNIAKIEPYEDLVLAQTTQFLDQGRLDDAYDQLAFLLRYYPRTSGLPAARQRYLYLAAREAIRQQHLEAALGLIEELLGLQPPFQPRPGEPPVRELLTGTAEALFRRAVAEGRYEAARRLRERLARQYRTELGTLPQAWQQTLLDLATAQRDAARAHLAAGRLSEAHQAATAMRAIWPEVPGGAALLEELAQKYPRVLVAVEQLPQTADAHHLLDRAARRAGRLLDPPWLMLEALGSEGGIYRGAMATCQRSEDGRSLEVRFTRPTDPAIVPYALELAALARRRDSPLAACWGELLGELRLAGPGALQVSLRQPHVLPEAILALLSPAPGNPPTALGEASSGRGPYQMADRTDRQLRLVRCDAPTDSPSGPAEIVEHRYDDPQRAIQALLAGDVDLVERVLPADLPALAGRPDLAVVPYAAPSVHVLLVRSPHPYLQSATYRRALLYGSNRELLLRDGLLRGQNVPGCRVVSGPFPAPVSAADEAAYACDDRIEPRPYDPHLALALRLVAEEEVAARSRQMQQPLPARGPLRLAHPAHELARIACRGLAQQWEAIGITCTLVELPPGQCLASSETCDLLYAELAAREPLVDAVRLFSPQGLVPQASPAVMALARQAARARNWPQARQQLLLVHRLVHEELPLVPLWQWRDQFACRRTVEGAATSPLELYDQVERWRVRPQPLAGRTP